VALVAKFQFPLEKQLAQQERVTAYAPTKSLIQYLDQTVKRVNLNNEMSRFGSKHRMMFDSDSGLAGDEIYDIKTLKILESLVTWEIDSVEKIDRVQYPEKWAKAEKRKVTAQNVLNHLGCTLMAERLLTSDREGVISASIRLLIVLLDGGNTTVQSALETYWLGTR
jgi:hypothetical protein